MKDAGVCTVLVLSGETKPEDLISSPFQPDFVFSNLADLLNSLQKVIV
jgi:ribonucleotide monophosphatase NagD (HAD superfamily)